MADIEKARPASPHSSGSDRSISQPPKHESHVGVQEYPNEYAAELAAMSPEDYRAMEKKLLWKIDRKLIPWMTLLYLMSFLDRVNVGAAKLVGELVRLDLERTDAHG